MSVIKNMRSAATLSSKSIGPSSIILVAKDENVRSDLEKRIDRSSNSLFNRDRSTKITVIKEARPRKKKQGNFLGILSAWQDRIAFSRSSISERNALTLIGMDAGDAKRLSPIAQSNGCSKSSVTVTPRLFKCGKSHIGRSALELSLYYFTPVHRKLEDIGFNGVLVKWCDDIQIPDVDLEKTDAANIKDADVIKFVSLKRPEGRLALEKDWIIYEKSSKEIKRLLSRNEPGILEEKIKNAEKNGFRAGVNLGPVALSNEFLDAALEVFGDLLDDEKAVLDLDPYLLDALIDKRSSWDEMARKDLKLKELIESIPDLLQRIDDLYAVFKKKHKKRPVIRCFDLGEDLFWADIGSQKGLREHFLSWTDINISSRRGRPSLGQYRGRVFRRECSYQVFCVW